jgi:hypothetical protein
MRQEWDEVQILAGRRIVHRCGTEDEAARWIARQALAPSKGAGE